MKRLTFNLLHKKRKKFLSKYNDQDHAVCLGEGNVLISAPHGVSQLRLGMLKLSEIGSLATALYLHEKNNCHLIAKTKNAKKKNQNLKENLKFLMFVYTQMI